MPIQELFTQHQALGNHLDMGGKISVRVTLFEHVSEGKEIPDGAVDVTVYHPLRKHMFYVSSVVLGSLSF